MAVTSTESQVISGLLLTALGANACIYTAQNDDGNGPPRLSIMFAVSPQIPQPGKALHSSVSAFGQETGPPEQPLHSLHKTHLHRNTEIYSRNPHFFYIFNGYMADLAIN